MTKRKSSPASVTETVWGLPSKANGRGFSVHLSLTKDSKPRDQEAGRPAPEPERGASHTELRLAVGQRGKTLDYSNHVATQEEMICFLQKHEVGQADQPRDLGAEGGNCKVLAQTSALRFPTPGRLWKPEMETQEGQA